MKNKEITLNLKGLPKSWSWSIFKVIFKQAENSITMMFLTNKYFSIFLQFFTLGNERNKFFKYELSLENFIKTVYFWAKNTSRHERLRFFPTSQYKIIVTTCVFLKTGKNRQLKVWKICYFFCEKLWRKIEKCLLL